MYKNILIRQPAGIGDIFFTQKIAYALHKEYKCDIIWPVIPEFQWIKEYIKPSFINFVNIESNFPYQDAFNNDVPYVFEWKDCLVVPLQRADWAISGSVMDAKYKLVGLDFEDWADYFFFERNIEKENKLFYEILGLRDDDMYSFISKNYGSPPNHAEMNIDSNKSIKRIEMQFIDGYSIFDWCKVIENATEIKTVDSSINFIIDKLILKTIDITLYKKPTTTQTSYHLFNTKYKEFIQ